MTMQPWFPTRSWGSSFITGSTPWTAFPSPPLPAPSSRPVSWRMPVFQLGRSTASLRFPVAPRSLTWSISRSRSTRGAMFPQNTYSLVGRIDFSMSDKTTMYFRAARRYQNEFNGSTTYGAYPQYDTGTLNINSSYLYSLNHIFSGSLLNSAKLSYTRFNDGTSFDTALVNTPNLMLVSPEDPATGANISMPGLQNLSEPGSGGVPAGGPQNTIQPQDVSDLDQR